MHFPSERRSANETDHCQSERSADICPHHGAVWECRWFIQSLVQQHHEHGHVADSGLPADLSDRGRAIGIMAASRSKRCSLIVWSGRRLLSLILTICPSGIIKKDRNLIRSFFDRLYHRPAGSSFSLHQADALVARTPSVDIPLHQDHVFFFFQDILPSARIEG